jgi:hypothetical protein
MKLLKFTVLFIALALGLTIHQGAFAEPLYSPAWGFRIDLPEGYEYSGGDLKDRFSFKTKGGAAFDLVVYPGTYQSVEALASDVSRRLGNRGDVSFFDYRTRKAALIELLFSQDGPAASGAGGMDGGAARGKSGQGANMREGWGLCVELDAKSAGGIDGGGKGKTLLLALAYGPTGKAELEALHLSGLDSIAPSAAEQRYCGPVTEFTWPRGELKKTGLAGGLGVEAMIAEHDSVGAQALVDREFAILRRYADTPLWKEAWIRFYRAIYRDSWERIADAAFQLERYWAVQALHEGNSLSDGALAAKSLAFVQGFKYERDLMGSDFVNMVSAVRDGRGDCDSRALLWAVILSQADIPSCIMVSKDYSHAMGLTTVEGGGAHFELEAAKWLVAETTANVAIGLIDQNMSEIDHWLGVTFE